MTKRVGLNLGCGRVQFPINPTSHLVGHLIKYMLTACPEVFSNDVEWINVDKATLPGIENCNLFSYPWIRGSTGRPFENNSVDIIWASHIIEHIPHDATKSLNEFAYDDLKQIAKLDGWYAWFCEAYRVLKPDGIIHVLTPYAFSASATGDPSHTRYIIPETFSYFAPNDRAPFDYQIPYSFAATGNAELRINGEAEQLYEKYEKLYSEVLEARANQRADANDLEEQAKHEMDAIQRLVKHSVNIIEEFFLSMKPVKA